MIKISLDKMELPEWDIIKSNPIRVPLRDKKEMIFQIPVVEKYFDFEAIYAKYLATYSAHFSTVSFMEYKDFKKLKLKKAFIKEIKPIMQIEKAKHDFIIILQKYFQANFKIKKIMKYIDLIELSSLFMFIHNVIEMVKKKMLDMALEMVGSGGSSTISKRTSEKVVPRF